MTNYKNTPEGRVVQSKYADLLPLSRPAPIKPRMTMNNEGNPGANDPYGYDEHDNDDDD